MAILIPLTRVAEDDGSATYDATTSKGRTRLRVSKSDGTVEVLADQSDPDAVTDFVVARATKALRLHWERGEYPPETDYRH